MSHFGHVKRLTSDLSSSSALHDTDEGYYDTTESSYPSSYNSWRSKDFLRGGGVRDFRGSRDVYRTPLTDDANLSYPSALGVREDRVSYARDEYGDVVRDRSGDIMEVNRSYRPAIPLPEDMAASPSSSPDIYRYQGSSSYHVGYHSLRKPEGAKRGMDRSTTSYPLRGDNPNDSLSTMPSRVTVDETSRPGYPKPGSYNTCLVPPKSGLASRSAASPPSRGGVKAVAVDHSTTATAGRPAPNNKTGSRTSGLWSGLADRLTGGGDCGHEGADLTSSRWCSLFILILIVLVIVFVLVAASVLYYNCEYDHCFYYTVLA